MVGELKLELIWNIPDVGTTEENWEFSPHYHVPIENNVLRELLQGGTNPPLRIVDHVDLLKLVRVLVTEVRTLTDGTVEISEAGYSVRGNQQLFAS